MEYIADLHIHSHFSMATSKNLRPEYLDYWARLKGIDVVGTGDISHPGWLKEMQEKLEPAGNGFYRLKKDFSLPYSNELSQKIKDREIHFMLTGEVSSIYKKGDKVRKVHNVVFLPDFSAVERFQARLARIGNIISDGRPILGLDSRDLLEIVLETADRSFLVPAHIWTPWFSVLGSKSGFDRIDECFEDLTGEIFAVETGLSSDPAMNWACSFLDKFLLISNSDAHSPEKLGREANLFNCEFSYDGLYNALKYDQGLQGTLEFFPQEGKYHYDGHRKCDVCLNPLQTLDYEGNCPKCGRPLVKGVMYRVAELADREDIFLSQSTNTTSDPKTDENSVQKINNRKDFFSLTPLPDILAEIYRVKNSRSKKIQQSYLQLINNIGPEFYILREAEIKVVQKYGGQLLAEALYRLRRGEVFIEEGYDGEYGHIKFFQEKELDRSAKLTSQTSKEITEKDLFQIASQTEFPAKSQGLSLEKDQETHDEKDGQRDLDEKTSPSASGNDHHGAALKGLDKKKREERRDFYSSVFPVLLGHDQDRKQSLEFNVREFQEKFRRQRDVRVNKDSVQRKDKEDSIKEDADGPTKDSFPAQTEQIISSKRNSSDSEYRIQDTVKNIGDVKAEKNSNTLNSMQRQAVEYVDGSLLVQAGPGTGKTHVLTEKLKYLLEKGYADADAVLAITFTRKAASELQDRIRNKLSLELKRVYTFHRWGQLFLQSLQNQSSSADDSSAAPAALTALEENIYLGFQSLAKILRKKVRSQQTSSEIFKEKWPDRTDSIWAKERKKESQGEESKGKSLDILDADSQDEFITWLVGEKDPNAKVTVKTIHDLKKRISHWKNTLILFADNLVSRQEKRDDLRESFRPEEVEIFLSYHAYLWSRNIIDIDDLLFLPALILTANEKLLRRERKKISWLMVDEIQDINAVQFYLLSLLYSSPTKYFLIGDSRQSIYGFRGAGPQWMQSIKNFIHDLKEINLEQSYRCPNTVLQLAESVLEEKNRLLGRGDEDKGKVRIHEYPSDRSEAEDIARTIEKSMGGLRSFSTDSGVVDSSEASSELERSFSDFAILCRSSLLFPSIQEALENHAIPYQLQGDENLWDKPPLPLLLRSLRFFLGQVFLPEDITREAGDLAKPLQESLSRLQKNESLERIFYFLLDHLSLRESWFAYEIRSIVDYLSLFDKDYEKFSQDILFQKNLLEYSPTHQNRQNAVHLMTMHASKGLEFSEVFIPACEANVIPWTWFNQKVKQESSEEQDSIAKEKFLEEERVLYVAMTRSKSRLYISHVKQRSIKGIKRSQQASPFLNRFAADLVEFNEFESKKIGNKKKKTEEKRQLDLF